MKAEIKERLDKIKRGEILEGYKSVGNKYIPESWTLEAMGKLVERIRKPVKVELKKKYRQIGIRSHGKGLFYKEEVFGSELGNKAVFWVEPDCFILNIVFAWEMAIAKTTSQEIGMIASHRFPMYKPLNGKLNLDFLTYFFMTEWGKNLLELASPGGAGRNRTLSQNDFMCINMTVPPIEEQQKIVRILLTWDKAIKLKEELIKKKKEQQRELENKLLTGKVRLQGFDGEWSKVKLGECGKTINGLIGKTANDFGEGKPFIPYKNIFANSKVDVSYLELVKISSHEKQTKVQYGDIFFTTSSETPEEVALSSVLLDEVEEVYLNSFCFGYRLNNYEKLLPEFLRFYLRSFEFRNKAIKMAQGSTRFNISKNEIMNITIRIPEIREQESISNILALFDRSVYLLEQELKAIRLQKNGLIKLLLTGIVRTKT